jgi:hypothetical protein
LRLNPFALNLYWLGPLVPCLPFSCLNSLGPSNI